MEKVLYNVRELINRKKTKTELKLFLYESLLNNIKLKINLELEKIKNKKRW